METINLWLSQARQSIGWAPDWAIGLVIAAIAATVALAVYGVVERIFRHLLKRRKDFWLPFLSRTRNLLRAAAVILAVNLAIQSPLFPDDVSHKAAQWVWVAVVLLLGWAVLIAVDIASARYMRNFRLDTSDNLIARKHVTQVKILKRAVNVLIAIVTVGAALMTFESVRQFGISLFASAGAAGLVVGLAARPVLANLIAGLQLAITQPIRIDDAVIVENEFGNVEDIGGAFVTIRLWDLRRLVVPLSYFIEKPFQNWTREGSALLGTVTFQLDYRAPVQIIREKAEELVKQSLLWDKKAFAVQVTETNDSAMEVRVLLSANDGGKLFDLRCEIREKVLAFLQKEHAYCLPRRRNEQFTHKAPEGEGENAPRRGNGHEASDAASSQKTSSDEWAVSSQRKGNFG